MVLDRRQRRISIVAIALIGAMGVRPPWRGVERTGTYAPVTQYAWIASPPELPWFLEQMNTLQNLEDPTLAKYLDPAKWEWQIDLVRLAVQWMTVALVFGGLLIMLKGSAEDIDGRPASGPPQKLG